MNLKSFIIIIIAFLAFFAGISLAQSQDQQKLPPAIQADTTSGWQLVFSNPTYAANNHTIEGLQYIGGESSICYASAFNGTSDILLKSTDLGLTWDSIPTSIPSGLPKFYTRTFGLSPAASAHLVWKTIDGDKTWTPHDRMSVAYGPIAFTNADTAVIFGISATARTTDAGETWNEIHTTYGDEKKDASFGSSQVGYAVGQLDLFSGNLNLPPCGFCQKTTDGGLTWKQIYTGIPVDLYCCKAIDEKTLFIGGDKGAIGRTFDGGITWDTMYISEKYPLLQTVSFINKTHGLIAGAAGLGTFYGIIYSTIDSAKTWQKQYIPHAPELFGVVMLNDSIALACGGGNIYRTTTGGNFSSVRVQNYDFKLRIFPNPSTGNLSIQYEIPNPSSVILTINNFTGIEVVSINLGIQSMGLQQASYNAMNLPNGAYFATLRAGSFSQTIPFTIQK